MTVAKLHKLLGHLIALGHARTPVNILKPSFTHPLEGDGVGYIDVEGVTPDVITVCDGDGCTAYNRDGSEKARRVVALYGASACRHGRVGECSMCERMKPAGAEEE